MASFEEKLRLLTDPGRQLQGLSLAEALQSAPEPAPVSIPDAKKEVVNARMAEKQFKLGQKSSLSNPFLNNEENSISDMSLLEMINPFSDESNYVDVAQSGLQQTANNIFDMLGNETGNNQINLESSDEAYGVTPELRQQLSNNYQDLYDDVGENGVFSLATAGSALKAAPGFIADSASIVPEIAVGSLLAGTGVGAVGSAGMAARRINKIASAFDKFSEAVDKSKAAKAALTTVKFVGGNSIKVSPATANIVQQNRNDYVAENGKEPTFERMAGDFLIQSALMFAYPPMLNKMVIPKALRTGKGPSGTLDEIRKASEEIVKNASKPFVRNIARRVMGNTAAVAAAGGSEAVQEYAQTWASVFATKLGTDETKTLMEELTGLIEDPKLRQEAKVAAVAGASAGGTLKAAAATPGAAVGTAFDAATAAGVTAGTKIKETADNAAFKAVTPEERESFEFKVKSREQALDELKKNNTAAAEELDKAATYKDIKSQTLQQRVLGSVPKGKDVNDPEVFEAAVNSVKANMAGSELASSAKLKTLKAKRSAKTVAEVAKNTAKSAVELVGITPETVDKAVEAVSDLSESAVDTLKSYKTSSARGLVQIASQHAVDSSRKSSKALRDIAQTASPKVVREIADLMPDSAVKTKTILRRAAERSELASKRINTDRDRVVTADRLDSEFKHAETTGELRSNTVANVAADLAEMSTMVIKDASVAKTVMSTIAALKKSSYFANADEDTKSEIEAFNTKLEKDLPNLRPAPVKAAESAAKVTREAFNTVTGKIENIEKPSVDFDAIKKSVEDFIIGIPEKLKNAKSVLSEELSSDNNTLKDVSDAGKEYINNIAKFVEAAKNDTNLKSQTDAIVASLVTAEGVKAFSKASGIKTAEAMQSVVESLFPENFKENTKDQYKAFLDGILVSKENDTKIEESVDNKSRIDSTTSEKTGETVKEFDEEFGTVEFVNELPEDLQTKEQQDAYAKEQGFIFCET